MFNKLSTGWVAILVLCVFGFSACDDEDVVTPPAIGTITTIAADDGRFTVLVSALQRTGLDAALNIASSRYTVFAPTDDAFAASGIDLASVSDDDLADILRYHVISGGTIYRSANIPAGITELGTLNDEGPVALPVTVNNATGGITVNGANVVVADVEAVNGVIHAIDAVLLPPSIADRAIADGRFTTLLAALARTGLDVTLSADGDYTVFAPTDDAFAAAGIVLDDVTDEDLTALLLYHVVGVAIPAGDIASGDNFVASLSATGPGESTLSLLVNQTAGAVTINGDATVVVANVFANNGVIHAIDKVLAPQSIVDFATKAEGLSSLAGALTGANLVSVLSGDGPFTVFAPVNSAFEAAADVIATLSAEQVTNVLLYHVVAGANVRSDALPEATTTVNGDMLIFNGATIETSTMQAVNIALTDIQATNGVVHLVPAVLVPTNL
ncbi:MAG: transforming growth factor-beta-induced protein [Neolewinella sp.]|jgi:transforming growth factor-beta-induced protein